METSGCRERHSAVAILKTRGYQWGGRTLSDAQHPAALPRGWMFVGALCLSGGLRMTRLPALKAVRGSS